MTIIKKTGFNFLNYSLLFRGMNVAWERYWLAAGAKKFGKILKCYLSYPLNNEKVEILVHTCRCCFSNQLDPNLLLERPDYRRSLTGRMSV